MLLMIKSKKSRPIVGKDFGFKNKKNDQVWIGINFRYFLVMRHDGIWFRVSNNGNFFLIFLRAGFIF